MILDAVIRGKVNATERNLKLAVRLGQNLAESNNQSGGDLANLSLQCLACCDVTNEARRIKREFNN